MLLDKRFLLFVKAESDPSTFDDSNRPRFASVLPGKSSEGS
jgi:hypothetical protein